MAFNLRRLDSHEGDVTGDQKAGFYFSKLKDALRRLTRNEFLLLISGITFCYFIRWLIQAVNKPGKPEAICHHSKGCPASGSILKACEALGKTRIV